MSILECALLVSIGLLACAVQFLLRQVRMLMTQLSTAKKMTTAMQEQLARLQIVHDAHCELSQHMVDGYKIHHQALIGLIDRLNE